jgi:O-antigen/teichoic acid export membrane protein
MRQDIISAYIATAARLASWLIVSAVVFRRFGIETFAIFTLIRSTLGILSYSFLSLAPALIHMLAREATQPLPAIALEPPANEPVDPDKRAAVLSYASTSDPPPDQIVADIYVTGEGLGLRLALIGFAVLTFYCFGIPYFHDISEQSLSNSRNFALFLGLGIVIRLISEAPSALLQVRHRIALDNHLVAAAELAWAAAVVMLVDISTPSRDSLIRVGILYCASNVLLLIARTVLGRIEVRSLTSHLGKYRPDFAREILVFGGIITAAQVANYLYAPVDNILINRLIDSQTVAVYGAAVQIDAGLLLLVSGLAAVLMPKSAVAHAAGDVQTVRRYYVLGTLASTAMLAAAAIAVWLLSPWIFKLWLDDEMTATQAILPLVLIHTVIGGSGGVGRSILLAVGKVKPFTIAVLTAAVANVIISFCAVRFFDWGLIGIISGTICAAVGCFGIWMPWYVLRTLKRLDGNPVLAVDS